MNYVSKCPHGYQWYEPCGKCSQENTVTLRANFKPDAAIQFNNDKGEIAGRLLFSDAGKLEFEGDVEESAQVFIDYLRKLYKENYAND